MNYKHAVRTAFAASALCAMAAAVAQPVPVQPVPVPIRPVPGPDLRPFPVRPVTPVLIGPQDVPVQPVPVPIRPVPGPGLRPFPVRPVTPVLIGPEDLSGRGSLADPVPGDVARHIKLTLTYDGTRIGVVRSERGEGPPRSYPYQQAELRVEMLDAAGATLRAFTLPDPRQLRTRETFVREMPLRVSRDRAIPVPAQPLPAEVLLPRRSLPQESVSQRAQAQFEVFLPDLPEASTLIVSRGGPSGAVLARIDLRALR